MKKFLLVLVVLVAMQGVCAATPTISTDKFDGKITVTSLMGSHIGDLNSVTLTKVFSNSKENRAGFTFTLERIDAMLWVFTDVPIQIKFDDNEKIYQLVFWSTLTHHIGTTGLRRSQHFSIMPVDIAFRVLMAKKVTIKLPYYGKPTIWEVDKRVIDEWKSTIATFPDGSIPQQIEIANPDTGNPCIVQVFSDDQRQNVKK